MEVKFSRTLQFSPNLIMIKNIASIFFSLEFFISTIPFPKSFQVSIMHSLQLFVFMISFGRWEK